MLSFYRDRLNKLVCGYNNEIIDTPADISIYITSYTESTDKLIFDQVASDKRIKNFESGMQMKWFHLYKFEIFMDEFTAKIIDCANNINEYQIQYKSSSVNNNDTIQIFNTNQIGEQGLAFIDIEIEIPALIGSFQVEAMNNKNKCIMRGGFISIPIPTSNLLFAKKNVVHKYFEKNIDTTGQGYVTIHEWIDVMKKIKGFKDLDEWEMKRIFYYIMYLKDDIDEMGKMSKNDFYGFLSVDMDTYCQVYKQFVKILQKQEPELLDDFLGWMS